MSPLRSDHSALVITSDPLLAAMVGALVEAAGLRAAFPDAGESPADALVRVKPLAAILVDGAAAEAASDVFLMRARKRGIALMLFGGSQQLSTLTLWARERDVRAFALPADAPALREALLRVPAGTLVQGERTDRRARTERASDGRLILIDEEGRRWSIYDRRGSDRRLPTHRTFIGETGEILGCDLATGEERRDSADVLAGQLSEATPEPSDAAE